MLEKERELKQLETKLKSFQALKDINKFIQKTKSDAEKIEKRIKSSKNMNNADLRELALAHMKIAKMYLKIYDIGQALKK